MGKTAYCFDLDGTITSEESLPKIARETNEFFDEILLLTEATLKGIIPVKSSLKLRFRILLMAELNKIQNVFSTIGVHDQIINWIEKHYEDCFIVTHNLDEFCKTLLEKIPCKSYTSKLNNTDNNYSLNLLDKGDAIREIRQKGYDNIVVIGEGFGDLPMFEMADTKISFGAVHKPLEKLIEISDYICFSEKTLCQTLNMLYYQTPD